jgi:hypothetical protein
MKPHSNSLFATGPAILSMNAVRSCGSVLRNWTAFTFSAQLTALDARQVVEDLASMIIGPEIVLLCWEAPGEYCHRRLAGGWLENELGIVVPELIC